MTQLDHIKTLQREVTPVLARASEIRVMSPDSRTAAMEFLRSVKAAQKRVTEFFSPIVEAAHTAWKQTTTSRASLLDPLDAAERTVKRAITTYDAEEDRKRLEEQRRLQAQADEEARRERERLEKQAAKVKTPEKKEALLEHAAAVVAPVVTIAAPERQAGEATRTNWKAKLTDKTALLTAAASGHDLAASLLIYDESAANRLAKTLKGSITIPGIEWCQEHVLSVKAE